MLILLIDEKNKIKEHRCKEEKIKRLQEIQCENVEAEIKDAATKKINDKASANAKLKALGLTDDEIEALK